jgi:hypothetical protein
VGAGLGQRGLRPLPQVGAGLGACVVWLGDGVGLVVFGADVVLVADGLGFGFGAVVVVVPPLVGRLLVAVATGRLLDEPVGGAVAAAEVLVAGAGVASGDGLSLTLTLRPVWSLPPNVEEITVSGNARKPMTASRPVAIVAIITMTTLDSTGPRCARVRATAGHLPTADAEGLRISAIGRNLDGLYLSGHFL